MLVERRPVVVLGCLVLVSALVRALLATRMATPWIFVDELVHSDLARSVEEHGNFLVRGHHVTVSFVYPLLIAPAWAAGAMSTTYTIAKTINAVVMSLAAVPVYFWGRRFLSARGALTAAALTLCLPVFVLTGTLMMENAYLPAFLFALFALGLALERPSLARQGLVVVGLALTVLTRVQGLLLVPIVVSAVLLDAWLTRRWRRVAEFWPLGAIISVAVVAYVVAKVAAGKSVLALGVYAGVRRAGYSFGAQAKWFAFSAGELALVLGVVPLCALLVVLARAREAEPSERAFLAVAAPVMFWSVLLGAFAAEWQPFGLKERYMVHAAPVAFLGLVLWLQRGARRARKAFCVAIAAVVLVAVLPLGRLFGDPAFLGNTFGLIPFERLGSTGAARAVAIVGAVVAAGLFLYLPRRLAVLLPAAVGVFLLGSSVPVFTTYRSEARAARLQDRTWIDRTVGHNAHVIFLNTANFEPETLQGKIVQTFEPVWESEFWNRSFGGVVSLGVQEPSPLPQTGTALDWTTGQVVGVSSPFVVARPRFQVLGESLARNGDMELFRTAGPVRLATAEEGVDEFGHMQGGSAFSGWVPARAVRVYLTAGPALIRVGTLVPQPGGGARIGRRTGQVKLLNGGTTVVRLPPAPYRVDVLGPSARVEFTLVR
jgi:hypothetical protein